MSFEQELTKLQEAVAKLEGGELSLSESLDVYKAGLGAVKNCKELLEKEKGELKLLQNDFSELKTEVEDDE